MVIIENLLFNWVPQPTDPRDFARDNDIMLVPYDFIATSFGMSVEDMKTQISRYAFSFYSHSHGRCIIAYDDQAPKEVQNFWVGHEGGHIYYGDVSKEASNFKPAKHLTIAQKAEQKTKEILANHFADFITGKVPMLISREFIMLLREHEKRRSSYHIPTPKEGKKYDVLRLRAEVQWFYVDQYQRKTQIGKIIRVAKQTCKEKDKLYSFVCPNCGRDAKAYITSYDGYIHIGCECCMDFVDFGF